MRSPLSIHRRQLSATALAAACLFAATRGDAGEVIDGDTFELQGERLRLHGIDAFELDQMCQDASGAWWPCGKAARKALIDRAAGGHLTCTKTGTLNDSISARCILGDGTDLGGWLVRHGWALDYERYSDGEYADEERAARRAGAGAWAGEFIAPWVWRRAASS